MDFRKLSFFEAVCRLHSFTKASAELRVTQPSVTIAIQRLEEELEVALLNRHKGSFTLTPEGEYLYEKSQLLLKELEDTKHILRKSAAQHTQIIRIGYSLQVREALQPILRHFQEHNTNIKVIENESSTPSIVRQLEENSIDFGVVVTTKDMSKHVEIAPLFQGEIHVCVSSHNPLSTYQEITLEQFEKQPLIALSLNEPRNSFIFNVLQEAYPERKLSMKPLFSTLMLNSYIERILVGDCVGLTYHDRWFSMEQYIPDNADLPRCVEIPFIPRCSYTVALIYPKGKVLTGIKRDFYKHIMSAISIVI